MSNTKEDQTLPVLYAASQSTEGPLKLRELKVVPIVALSATANLAEKKSPASYVASPFSLASIEKLAAEPVQIKAGLE